MGAQKRKQPFFKTSRPPGTCGGSHPSASFIYYLNNPLGCSKLSSRLPPSLPAEGAGLHLHGNPPATAWGGGREGDLKEHSAWDVGDTRTLMYVPTGSKAPSCPVEVTTQACMSPHRPPRPTNMQAWYPHFDRLTHLGH